MSGFGGKADVPYQPSECPELAKTRHSGSVRWRRFPRYWPLLSD